MPILTRRDTSRPGLWGLDACGLDNHRLSAHGYRPRWSHDLSTPGCKTRWNRPLLQVPSETRRETRRSSEKEKWDKAESECSSSLWCDHLFIGFPLGALCKQRSGSSSDTVFNHHVQCYWKGFTFTVGAAGSLCNRISVEQFFSYYYFLLSTHNQVSYPAFGFRAGKVVHLICEHVGAKRKIYFFAVLFFGWHCLQPITHRLKSFLVMLLW